MTPSQRRLGYQDVAHRQHAQAAQFLGRVEDDGRESGRHLRVQSYFNARLDLVLALDLRGASSRRGDGVERVMRLSSTQSITSNELQQTRDASTLSRPRRRDLKFNDADSAPTGPASPACSRRPRGSTSSGLCGNDTVAQLPWLPHETRRLSWDHDEGVEATRDAIAALTKSSSSFPTPSQRR